jgi:hypothetical protein
MKAKSTDLMQRFFIIIVLAVSLVVVVTYLLSMGLGILVFFSNTEGLEFSRERIRLPLLMFTDVEVSVNAGLYFIFLWWVFALCFVAAAKSRENLVGESRETLSGNAKGLFRNNLLAMPAIASILLVVVLVLHYVQTQGGIPTGEPSQSEPLLDFIWVSRAPLVEEVVFRVIPIGAFLVTYIPLAGRKITQTFSAGQRLKLSVLSILQPDRAKEMVSLKSINEHGLLGGMVWAEWMMVAITAFLFGVAHYFGGWGPGKISQAAISGAVFAVAYLYYGVQAPILLHWFFNYYFSVFYLAYDYIAKIDLASIVESVHLSFGIFLWLAMLIFGGLALFRMRGEKPEPQELPSSTA